MSKHAEAMRNVELCIEINLNQRIAATVFLPPKTMLKTRQTIIFALPGGGYARGYYNLQLPSHPKYSQAEYHVQQGHIFVALDHLGVGDSSTENATSLRIEDIAAANARAVEAITEKLREGSLLDDLPAIEHFVRIGIGQSMGGCITVVMQANHACYDGIGVLGYSAIHTVLPQPTEEERARSIQGHHYSRETASAQLSLETSSASISSFSYPFHWEDVPEDIIAEDMSNGFPLRTPPVPAWASATVPNCAITMMSPGAIAAEAAAIRVPVFIGVGERDTCPTPHAEPSAYQNSTDVSLSIIPQMAHMHNFAGTRHTLWARLEEWYTTIVREAD